MSNENTNYGNKRFTNKKKQNREVTPIFIFLKLIHRLALLPIVFFADVTVTDEEECCGEQCNCWIMLLYFLNLNIILS